MNIPPVIKSLLLLNVAAYFFDLISPSLLGTQLSGVLGLYYFESPFFQPCQLFTYMFMHGGAMHLLFNMFALWMFGRSMETVWGAKKFILYYLFCGIGAGLVQEAGQFIGFIHLNAMTIGASGAVYGILLAYGMTFPEDRIFIIPIPFPIKAKWFVCIYAVIELLEGMNTSSGVAHFAHLGGMFFGLMLILYWKGQLKQRTSGNGNFWTQSHTGRTKMHISYGGRYDEYSKAPSDRKQDYEYNAEKQARDREVDRILNKVRQGGYSSLTEDEKQRLFDASKR